MSIEQSPREPFAPESRVMVANTDGEPAYYGRYIGLAATGLVVDPDPEYGLDSPMVVAPDAVRPAPRAFPDPSGPNNVAYHDDGRVGIQGPFSLAQEIADQPVFDCWDVSQVRPAPGQSAAFLADDSNWVYEVTVTRIRRA